jgi:lipid-A-disaccharide synthase
MREVEIFLSACEASSDRHGAALLEALKKTAPTDVKVKAYGIGGDHLQALGFEALAHSRQLSVMGFVEILGRLPRILSILSRAVRIVLQRKPDILVFLDYPGFNFRLAKKLKKGLQKFQHVMVYYIPPKVWVWKKKRLSFLKNTFDLILTILPFEEAFYAKEKVAARYVGNPLIDEIPLDLEMSEAKRQLGFQEKDELIALMPGSRPSEIERHVPVMLSAVARLVRNRGQETESKLHVLMSLGDDRDHQKAEEFVKKWEMKNQRTFSLKLLKGTSHKVLAASKAGLIKSGTSTLEAGLLGCVHVVVYRPTAITAWIVRNIMRYRGPFALVNLVGGWTSEKPEFFPEILAEEVTADRLAHELSLLLSETEKRKSLEKAVQDLKQKVFFPEGKRLESPSTQSAHAIWELYLERFPKTKRLDEKGET